MPSSKGKKAAAKRANDAEMKLLVHKLGSLSTYEEIAEASHLLATLRVPGAGCHKWQKVRDYIESKVNRDWIWTEIELYRMIGQTSSFLLDGPELDIDPGKSETENDPKIRALRELESAVQAWSYLALEGALGHLLMHEDVHEVKERGGSAAELFRAFLRAHEVEVWDEQCLYDVRMYIFGFTEDFRRVKREQASPDPDATRRSGSVVVLDASTAARQLSSSCGSQGIATSSLKKHGHTVPETRASKRPRVSNVEKQTPVSSIAAEDDVADEPPMFTDEDIYNASPPPATSSSMRRSSPSPRIASIASVATEGTLLTEPAREVPALQTQANGNYQNPSRTSHNGSERPEDFFMAKVSKVTDDIKSARNEIDILSQKLDVTKKKAQLAGENYDLTVSSIEVRIQEVKTLCLNLSSNKTSTSIRAAAKACRVFGLAEEDSLLTLLEPVLIEEEAQENYNEVASKLDKLENKLNRLSEIFDED
ncbi:hypothetical protein BKA65DRAFT_496189 [Rhexocercosporidium sp. MPI-PUGE-AT-0058]|nr:hypothetical protein BKA65DRAFT_496189 [Rhexocercosporidium sp. MPI-PUGE-AT-0058]